MISVPLCFIVSKPTTLSKSDQKRRRSKALSHAAVVAYTRRNPGSGAWIQVDAASSKSKPAQQSEDSKEGLRSIQRKRADLLQPTGHHDATKVVPDTERSSSHTYISRSAHPSDLVLYKELDPFLKPAAVLSHQERNNLHHYLITTPARIYGTRPGTLFCSVRDVNVPQIQVNRLWLQWTLLYAERFAITDDSRRAVALLSRRAKIYPYINELMADATSRLSDNTITGLAFGSLIEWQLGSLDLARQHLAFVRHTLLPQRTGPQTPSFLVGVVIYTHLISVGLGTHAFTGWRSLTAAVERLLKIIPFMQQQLNGSPIRRAGFDKPSLENQCSVSSSPLPTYVASHQRTFGRSSKLHKLLVPGDPKDTVLSSHQLTLLWLINKILLELHGEPEKASDLLDTLHRYVESHDDPSHFDSGTPHRKALAAGPVLKPFTVTAMLGHISGSYLPKSNPEAVDWSSEVQPETGRPLLRFWENVDMVELLRLLPDISKDKMVQQLSAWLIGPQPGHVVQAFREDELEAFGHEIRCAWLKQARLKKSQSTS